MGKFDGVFFVADCDDTLLNSAAEVSSENRAAIEYFIAGGGLFTVATGRALLAFERLIGKIPFNAPAILSNGSMLYDFDKNETVFQALLPDRIRADIRDIITNFPDIAFESYHENEVYSYNPNIITRKHLLRVGTDCIVREPEEMPLPWLKVILQQDTPFLEAVEDYIRRRFGDHYEIIFSNRFLLELTTKGTNKGSGVLRVADMLSVDHRNIYCVGDNQNDIPMLEISAIPFAPENASEKVKEWGARIVSSCDEHSIRDIVNILDEIY